MFIDQIHLMVQAGDGGHGCESYSHRTDKKIVPEGGDGGNGGRVIFRADHNAPPIASLRFKQHQIAESGGHGGSSRKRGRNGKDLIILVPPGTRIFDRQRRFLIRELLHPSEEVIVLQGGRGGTGNSLDRPATPGEKGNSLDVELTLRIQADIFFVGTPNSGKSSLLNKLTGSRAKEEHYPFATTLPEIGVYQKSDYEKLTLCELPSIYGASHEGRGRGNDFLKHLEDARFLFYILSIGSEFGASLTEQFRILREQIRIFNPTLLKIPYAIVINKVDLGDLKLLKKTRWSEGASKFFISVKTGEGLKPLVAFLNEKIEGAVYPNP